MYFRRYRRMNLGNTVWFEPLTRFHYTPEGAMGEVWQEARNRFPYNKTARELFASNTYPIGEEDAFARRLQPDLNPPIPITGLSFEVRFVLSLDELLVQSPHADREITREKAQKGVSS